MTLMLIALEAQDGNARRSGQRRDLRDRFRRRWHLQELPKTVPCGVTCTRARIRESIAVVPWIAQRRAVKVLDAHVGKGCAQTVLGEPALAGKRVQPDIRYVRHSLSEQMFAELVNRQPLVPDSDDPHGDPHYSIVSRQHAGNP